MKNSHKTQRKSFKRFHRTQNVKVSKFSYFFRKKFFLEFPAPVHARETRILNFFKLELLESNNCFFYTQFSYMYIHVCFRVNKTTNSKTFFSGYLNFWQFFPEFGTLRSILKKEFFDFGIPMCLVTIQATIGL